MHRWREVEGTQGQPLHLRHDQDGLVVAAVEKTPQGAVLTMPHCGNEDHRQRCYISVTSAKNACEVAYP